MKKEKVVVTGATGFIGSRLVKRLRQKNLELRLFDRQKHDFENVQSLSHLLKDCDIIFHLASVINPNDAEFDFNTKSTKNLLQTASRVAPDCRVIFTSSYAVYRIPNKGEVISENFPVKPRNAYGTSKLRCEKLLNKYHKIKKIKTLSLRLSNVYGPSNKPNNHSVISNFINKIKNGEPITIDGDGSQERDFIYVDDAVNALILALKSKNSTIKIINICSGESISILKLVKLIEKAMGKKAKITYNRADNQGAGYWRTNNILARKILKWKPKIKLKKGLQFTLDAYNN